MEKISEDKIVKLTETVPVPVPVMLKNERGPITYARGKMPGGFSDIAGTTARTKKLICHTRTRDRIFHTKQVTDLHKMMRKLA